MKDEKKCHHDGTVDESSLEQQRKSDATEYLCFVKFLEPYPYSASGFYGLQNLKIAID